MCRPESRHKENTHPPTSLVGTSAFARGWEEVGEDVSIRFEVGCAEVVDYFLEGTFMQTKNISVLVKVSKRGTRTHQQNSHPHFHLSLPFSLNPPAPPMKQQPHTLHISLYYAGSTTFFLTRRLRLTCQPRRIDQRASGQWQFMRATPLINAVNHT